MQFTSNWGLMKHYLKPFKTKLIYFATVMLITLLFQLISPKIVEVYMDFMQDPEVEIPFYLGMFLSLFPEEYGLLLSAGILYIIFSLVQWTLSTFTVFTSQQIAWASTNQLRYDLTKHCMNLDMTFHNRTKPGEMIERVDGDVANLAVFFSQFSVRLIMSSLLILGVLIILFFEHWIIGLVFVGFIVLSFTLVYLVRNVSVPKWRKLREKEADIFGYVEEILSGKEEIKANGMDGHIMNKFHIKSKEMYDANLKALLFNRIFRSIVFGLTALSIILVFAPGIPLLNNEDITYGSLFAILIYTSLIRNLIFQIVQEIQNLQQTSASIIRIQELFAISTNIEDKGKTSFPKIVNEIKFDNLSFNYNEKEVVLSDLSFTIGDEKSMGLIGHTGCGKTTISRLIFRLYEPQNGTIKINDINIQDFPLDELRKNISYVTQDIQLFHATVRDNITFFDKSFTDQQILEVIEDLQLGEWFRKLPNGLDTKLNSGEVGLSAGESQLLALTRVFLKNPKIVILDEASSRLDPATELLLNNAVTKLIKGRIAIIIAHRLSTLEQVDDILILTKGSVLEYGERKNLIEESSSIYNQYLAKGMQEVLQ